MQIAIDIPEEKYDWIMRHLTLDLNFKDCKITPLPENHGDLKDVSKLDILSWQGKSDEFTEGVAWAMEQLDSLPTIIPATRCVPRHYKELIEKYSRKE